jgi:hypothetical protein
MALKKKREEIKTFLEFNKIENPIYHSLWDTAKALPRGKIKVIKVYIENREISQINDIMLHCKLLEILCTHNCKWKNDTC